MTIDKSHIKLFASARMTDELGGGGAMSGTALQDGAENNVFPDISTLDRAQGALQFRKVYPVAVNPDTDPLLGVHVIFDDMPDDPTVGAVLLPSTGQAQDVAALTAAMNAAGEEFQFRGAAYTTDTVAADSALIPVAAVRAVLIPKTVLSEAVAGDLEADGAQPTVVVREPSGQTVALTFGALFGSFGPTAGALGAARLRPGSVTGTFTNGADAGTISSTADGVVTAVAGAATAIYQLAAGGRTFAYLSGANFAAATAQSITAEVLVDVALPKQTARFPAVEGQVTYTLALPPGTAVNSESVLFTLATPILLIPGTDIMVRVGGATPNDGKETLAPVVNTPLGGAGVPSVNFAAINRSTGVLTLVLPTPAANNTDIVVTYAAGGGTVPLASAALVSAGLFAGGIANVTPGGGLEVAGAAFQIVGGASDLALLQGVVRTATGTVVGSGSTAGALTIPGNDGRTITGWFAVQRDPNYGVLRVDATLPASLVADTLEITGTTAAGAGFTATSDASGVFATAHVTGTYVAATGALSLVFAASTRLRSLAYSATQESPQVVFAPMWGLDPSRFASDGTVPIIRPGNVAVLRHTTVLSAATYANTNTINAGRTDLADVRFIDANGRSIPNGWSVNLATGITTVNDITGWVQPVKFQHSIEHVAMVLGVPNSGAALLSRAVTREFPAGSLLSTALLMGEFQARAGLAFAQESWTGVWSDTRIGDPIAPQYQQAAHPIVVTNEGAITERWAIHFDTNTQFRLVGETVGQIATGSTNSALAPVNPATGVPYFTLSEFGWGGGWAAGHVLRWPTTGANGPVWCARSLVPSAPSLLPDSLTLSTRGDRNA